MKLIETLETFLAENIGWILLGVVGSILIAVFLSGCSGHAGATLPSGHACSNPDSVIVWTRRRDDSGTYDVQCVSRTAAPADASCPGGRLIHGAAGDTCEMSWDQEHLKKGDNACPNSNYDAPNGKLRRCPN